MSRTRMTDRMASIKGALTLGDSEDLDRNLNRLFSFFYDPNPNHMSGFLKAIKAYKDGLEKMYKKSNQFELAVWPHVCEVENLIEYFKTNIPTLEKSERVIFRTIKEGPLKAKVDKAKKSFNNFLDQLDKEIEESEKHASITACLDEIAGELEKVDPRLALAVDQVSDRLEIAGHGPGIWRMMPVKKDEIKKLVKIFIAERAGVLNKIHDDYTKSVVQEHLDKVQEFTTEKELNDDLVRHLRMTFEEWFESLPGNFTPSKTTEKG